MYFRRIEEHLNKTVTINLLDSNYNYNIEEARKTRYTITWKINEALEARYT